MSPQDVLQECYLAMAEVEYDLRRWGEELEIARWGSFLDQVIDIEMYQLDVATKQVWDPIEAVILPRPEPDNVRTYPLAWYEDGSRFEIGTAVYDPERGIIDARIDEHLTRGLAVMELVQDKNASYSIGPNLDVTDLNHPEYRVKFDPVFPRVGLDDFTMPPPGIGPYNTGLEWYKFGEDKL